METYQTVQTAGEAVIVEKKSRFISRAAHAQTEEEALAFLQTIRRAEPQASHHVYAYVLREGARTRYSDDGEPQKTAGLPVLEVLRGFPVTDTVLVVTRYFGGTLLGTGGLVRAYTASAQKALAAAQISRVSLCCTLALTVDYALRDAVVKLIEDAGAKELQISYGQQVTLSFCMLAGQEEPLIEALREVTRGGEVICGDPFFAPF